MPKINTLPKTDTLRLWWYNNVKRHFYTLVLPWWYGVPYIKLGRITPEILAWAQEQALVAQRTERPTSNRQDGGSTPPERSRPTDSMEGESSTRSWGRDDG